MSTKSLVLITLVMIAACDMTVNKADVCSACAQFKSEQDCINFGCTWTAATQTTVGSCSKITVTQAVSYCPGLADQTKCWSTYGCAFLDGKCTTFAGCSAYVKTSTTECQAISYKCISNGTTCTETQTCDQYTPTQCPSTPDLNGRACKVDETSGNCRNYNCSEADSTKTTNDLCNKFAADCVTTGAGCVTQLGACSTLTGTATTCPLMTGTDGKCKFVSGTTCTLLPCTDAPNTIMTNADCNTFQINCVTTGKGCIDTLGTCSSYSSSSCTGLIGTDNYCEQDGVSTCKAKKCENATLTTNDACSAYQVGCITNGKQCVTQLSSCASYSGITSDCQKLIGSDGNCTGSSSTTAGACRVKDCVTDSTSSFTTDAQCQAIQSNCKTTGFGCVSQASMASCSTYTATKDDGSDCANYIGSDGKCTYSGSNKKCTKRLCSNASTTNTTNQACSTYQSGCVTNGAGCQNQTTCLNTVSQLACQGTQENSTYCNWNSICVRNVTCSQFPTAAICAAYKTKDNVQCIWNTSSNQCRTSLCKDYTATSDSECNTLMNGCVSNGTICADPTDCTQFKGVQTTCEKYNAKCTQLSSVTDTTTQCIPRTCANASTDFKTNSDCTNYLGNCLTNGGGCIDSSQDCTQYTGTATSCPSFTGYVSQTVRIQCWSDSTSPAPCVQRTCKNATSMTSNSDCQTFLSGCIYNGLGGCVTQSDTCSSYGYTTDATICQNFLGNSATKCWPGGSGQCKDRECSDYTGSTPSYSDCNNFLSSCVSNGTACVPSTTPCSSFSGTADQCNAFTGNSKKCTRLTTCKSKVCTDKTNASTNADCVAYHTKCRLVYGATTCQDARLYCSSYTFTSGVTDAQKQAYCGQISSASKTQCAYDPATTNNCINRTACSQWSPDTNSACANYMGTATCIPNNNVCYPLGDCTSYTYPQSIADNTARKTWCQVMKNASAESCSYVNDAATCSLPPPMLVRGSHRRNLDMQPQAPTTCEQVSSPTDAAYCNDILNSTNCQFTSATSSCVTTRTNCENYNLPIAGQVAFCAALYFKTDNGFVEKCLYVGDFDSCESRYCEEITSGATSQAYCDNITQGCKYDSLEGSCYLPLQNCSSYTVTSSNTFENNLKICQNKVNNAHSFCTFQTGSSKCSDPLSACNSITKDPQVPCYIYRSSSGDACVTDQTNEHTCKTPSDYTESCSTVTNINTDSCDIYTTPGGCYNQSGSCVKFKDNCSSYNYQTSTDANTKSADCQNFADASGHACSWISNMNGSGCETAPSNCSGWTGLTTTIDNNAFCNARIDQSKNSCTYDYGASSCRKKEKCEFTTSPTSQVDCDFKSAGCTYFSRTCYLPSTSCNNYTASGISDGDKSAYCGGLKNTSGTACVYLKGLSKCSDPSTTCGYFIGSLSAASDKTTVCASAGCTYWPGSSQTCTAIQAACSGYTNGTASSIATDCASVKDTAGNTCYGASGATVCSAQTIACTTFTATGATPTDKSSFCSGKKNSSQANCVFLTGFTTCSDPLANCSYSISTLSAVADKVTACASVGCTYWPGSQNTCTAKQTACSGYTNGTAATIATDCASVKDTSGNTCYGAQGAKVCSAQPGPIVTSCEAVTSPASQGNCDAAITGCFYLSGKCYTKASNCGYKVSGTGSLALCAQFTNSLNTDKCTASSDTATTCQLRTCNDSNIPNQTTNSGCAAYKSSCKSNGTNCIDGTVQCVSISATDCTTMLDSDNQTYCLKFSSTDCIDFDCTLNATATTNDQCASFRQGCVTNGAGCVESTAPCSQYTGTQSTCSNFTGNSIKCWGSSTTTVDYCRNRVCTDKTIATNDGDCDNFLSGCVFNGVGCVAKNSPCSAYKGNQETCINFTESAGKCWNTATAASTAACLSRACTLYNGTTDTDCATYMPSPSSTPLCVTNGKSCVPSTTQCSGFQGTYLTCPNFTASDGPCKAPSISTTSAACVQRVCTDASNNLNTDALCKVYHPSCVTTGKGCVASSTCDQIQTQAVCSQRSGCQWASQCRAAPTNCGQLTSFGQSICTNTILNDGKTKCAWSVNVCRKFTCADYDASIITHEDCQALDQTCTTSGAGCVTYSTCNSYTSQSVCNAASTTDDSKRCQWDITTAKCRQRVCTDFQGTTNDDCNTFLAGCQTTGTACIASPFSCSAFQVQKFCLQDGNNLPCLWVNGVCYNYASCTDATGTLNGCKAFNPLCVPSDATCIAQNSCDQYKSSTECIIGVGATTCGWLPTGKCQVFGACADAIGGSSDSACQLYGSNCMTDGTNCVTKGQCQSYLTQTACESTNWGTDGQCKWTVSGTTGSCRLAVCTDKTATTDSDCLAYIVSTGKCTTDGTTCVARAACNTYTTQAACTIGSDGIPCTYSYPVGQTTGTQSCRVKECSDITGTTNDQCMGQIANKACVSNGKTCVKQDTCANYKNKLSCNGGGSDGACAFTSAATASDALAGTCQLFTSCDKANNDQAACNSKSSACQWTSTVSGTTTTTSCSAKNCIQAASGTVCNYIPSFDGNKYTICNLVNNVCTASDPSTLAQANCYSKSAYTYTWNESVSKCVACNGSSSINNTVNNTNNTNGTNTTTTNGYILGVTIPLAILGLLA